jgi:biopolymer transport protein ExbB
MNNKITVIPIVVYAMLITMPIRAEENAISLDELLKRVEQGHIKDMEENKAREEKFQATKDRQSALLADVIKLRKEEENKSKQLEISFDENEQTIDESQQELTLRLGDLKELFGVIQQVTGDARGQFENSLTNIHYPERITFMNKLVEKVSSYSQLAPMSDIEHLWFELQREMTASGKIIRFPATIVAADGITRKQDVIRIGLFNVISNGKYLEYDTKTNRLIELARQPQPRYLKMMQQLESSQDGYTAFALDPSRGQILSLLVQTPNLIERIEQGGVIGYIIIGLGSLALLVVIIRLLVLTITWLNVKLQIRNPDKPDNRNPLGRILQVYHANPGIDTESLELKLGEAIMIETPKLARWNMFIKIIAVVAPLLGLLGTVTGMIITFQAITLFGTGDPKLMAGGISQALVTTVLGLSVAIPIVLLHTLVNSRSKRLQEILEQQSAGLLATYAEKHDSETSSLDKEIKD